MREALSLMIPVTGFAGKRVGVFGLARTGLTAAQALTAGGAKVQAWDDNPEARARAKSDGISVIDLRTADFSGLSALMVSPGVPLTHPEPHWTVQKAKAAGVEVLGDIELFARTVNAAEPWKRPKIAAITGTNGKSTTTALLGPHPGRRRQGRPDRRQHRHGRARAPRHARGRGLRAGAVELPARPDVQP